MTGVATSCPCMKAEDDFLTCPWSSLNLLALAVFVKTRRLEVLRVFPCCCLRGRCDVTKAFAGNRVLQVEAPLPNTSLSRMHTVDRHVQPDFCNPPIYLFLAKSA